MLADWVREIDPDDMSPPMKFIYNRFTQEEIALQLEPELKKHAKDDYDKAVDRKID